MVLLRLLLRRLRLLLLRRRQWVSPLVSVLEPLLEPVTRQVREAVGAGVSRHEPSRVSHARSNTLLVYLLSERRSP